MERTLAVTLTLNGEEDATVEILEGETGDRVTYSFLFPDDGMAKNIGREILDWLYLMRDEQAYNNEQEDE